MSDEYTPTTITVDDQGRVGADFSGHVHAAGLDLDADITGAPPNENRIRWLRVSDGARVAHLNAFDDGTNRALRVLEDPNDAEINDVTLAVTRPGTDIGRTFFQIVDGPAQPSPKRYVRAVVRNEADTAFFLRVLLDSTGASDFLDKFLVDAKGDIIAATGADAVARKAVGANGSALIADSAQADGLRWGADFITKALVDAKGDIIAATANDTPARKAVGADGAALVADSSQADGLRWGADFITKALVDAKGDIIAATAADAVARKAVGADGQSLFADSAQADGLLWAAGLKKIADTTLGAAAASITFSSIPADFAHLLLITYGRGDTAAVGTNSLVRVNGDTAANYDRQTLVGSGGVATSAGALAQTSGRIGQLPANTAGAGLFGGQCVFIPHYAGTGGNKFAVSLGGHKQAAAATTDLEVGLYLAYWRSSSAITSLTWLPGAGNLVTGSRAVLYGLG